MSTFENTPKIYCLTEENICELIERTLQKQAQTTEPKPKRYVYGMKGIMELFGVSQVTACKYKRTFLQPAISQRGRKLIIDADKAIELFQAQK